MSSILAAEAVPTTNDRASGGRFAKHNTGGPGNPFARQTAALRAYLINHVTERDLQDILDILLLNAKGGHLPTIKFLFSYVLGKPKPVVEPDLLDLQEMEMLQQGAVPPDALETVCEQLPLDLQVQLMRYGQSRNQAQAIDEAQATLAAEVDTPAPGVAPSPNGENSIVEPSTGGDNGATEARKRNARPSPNGEKQPQPQLPGFDWLRDLRRLNKPSSGRSQL